MLECLMFLLLSAVYLAPDLDKKFRKFMGIGYAVIAIIAFFTKVR